MTELPLMLLQAGAAPSMAEDFNPGVGLFVLLLLASLVFATLAVVAVVSGAIGAAVASAVVIATMVVLALIAAGAIFHLLLALLVWTRRPPTQVWLHSRWWSLITLLIGPFAAVPYFVLHYRPGATPRCFRCGYDRRGIGIRMRCPECDAVRC